MELFFFITLAAIFAGGIFLQISSWVNARISGFDRDEYHFLFISSILSPIALLANHPDKGNNYELNKIIIPGAISILLLLGVTLYSGIKLFDSRLDFTLMQALSAIGGTLVFIFLFNLKNTFAILIVTINITYSYYQLYQHGIYKIWPIMQWVLEWIVTLPPDSGWTLFYTIAFSLYGLAGSFEIDI